MEMSQLRRYSVGVAAENKPLETHELNVTPVEALPGLDGEVQLNPEDKVHEGTDANGQPYQVRAMSDITLTATWLPCGSNRATAPDIRRGELIEIYRVADNDTFYWRDLGLRPDLRRLETVIFMFNATPDEHGDGLSAETCYWFEVSTHQKLVTFTTTQANGEPFGYSTQFNTGDGQFTLEDTAGNSLHLDSANTFIEFINAAQTQFQLDKTTLRGKANDHIAFEAGKTMALEAGNSLSLKAGTSIDMSTQTYTINATTTNINSDVVMAGSFYSSGISGDGAAMTLDGNMRFNGNINVTGGIVCDYITANIYKNLPS